MLYYIKTWWRWFRRCGLSRGFGVQSPSAYSFIRYVVNEHYPYYAYAELKDRLDSLSRREHKFGRLLFRLANFWQPDVRYTDAYKYLPYLYAGCHRSEVKDLSDFADDATKINGWGKTEDSPKTSFSSQSSLVVLDLLTYDISRIATEILPLCTPKTMLVLLNMQNRKKVIEEWLKIQDSAYTGITYDLYYAGIIFFDKSIYKQHYEVNF